MNGERIVHLAVYEAMADSEVGHLLVELHSGRLTGVPFTVVTVGESFQPVTTMGGIRIAPDIALGDLDPGDSCLLVLPGAPLWDAGGGTALTAAAARFLDAGVPVAAICGATAGLARAGLLDDRRHTSAAREYLAATGYRGGDHYVEARAVADRGVITAGPQSPVQFARAAIGALGLASDELLEAYEGVFDRADPAAFASLMALQHARPATAGTA